MAWMSLIFSGIDAGVQDLGTALMAMICGGLGTVASLAAIVVRNAPPGLLAFAVLDSVLDVTATGAAAHEFISDV
jgi:hypothetical protein